MAVVAVLLGTVVAASLGEGPARSPGTDDPRASFTFATDDGTVAVTHFGGDALDPAHVYVESGTRGRLGNFGGSAGAACTENLTRVRPGATCRVPNATDERLYVVWDAGENRSLILARRGADATASPARTAAGTATPTPTPATPPATAPPATRGPSSTTAAVTATAGGTATTPETTGTAPPTGTETSEPDGAPTATRQSNGTGTADDRLTDAADDTPTGTAAGSSSTTGTAAGTPSGTGTADE